MIDETVLRQVLELEQIIDELFQLATPDNVTNALWQKYTSIAGEHPGDTEAHHMPEPGAYIVTKREPGSGIIGRVTHTEGDMYYIYTPNSGEMSFNLKFYPYQTLLKART